MQPFHLNKTIFLAALLCLCLVGNCQPLAKKLDALINDYEKAGYHGTILVAKGKDIIIQRGYGIANQLTRQRNDAGTLYKTESVGKLFTAALILKEVEKGTIHLDDNLDKFFPDFNYPNGDKITIHHLLNHTSGLTEYYPARGKKYTLEEVKALRAAVPLAFQTPGEKFQYSNFGYAILGDLLEKVTGKKFDTVFQQELFNPAGMSHTRHLNDTVMPPNGAQPYHWYSSKRYELSNQTVGPKANGAGGWISAVNDFHNFACRLLSNELFSANSWEIMKTANKKGPMEIQKGIFYSYGLMTIPMGTKGKKIFGNTGGGGGFGCDLYFDPESGFIVVNFMNMYGNSRTVTKNVFNLLLGEPVEKVAPQADIALGDLLDEKGLTGFADHGLEYLERLGYNIKEPREFIRIASEYDEINDQATRKVLLKCGLDVFPEFGFLWLHYGRTLLKLKETEEAKKALENALLFGQKTNDQRLVNLSTNELKKI